MFKGFVSAHLVHNMHSKWIPQHLHTNPLRCLFQSSFHFLFSCNSINFEAQLQELPLNAIQLLRMLHFTKRFCASDARLQLPFNLQAKFNGSSRIFILKKTTHNLLITNYIFWNSPRTLWPAVCSYKHQYIHSSVFHKRSFCRLM